MKGEFKMSYQEIAKDIIDKLPADKMIYGKCVGLIFIQITSQIKKL